jgi:excisionase family DNA binding protein
VEQIPLPPLKTVANKPLATHTSYYATLRRRALQQAEQVSGLYSDPFLTCNEACQILRVSYFTLRKWLKAGLIHGSRTSARGRYRFRTSEIQRVAKLEIVA